MVFFKDDPTVEDRESIKKLYNKHPEYFTINFSELKKMKKYSSGTFSIVYKCVYKGELVAAKRIFGNGYAHFKYMSREIDILRNLEHPNILKFIGVAHKNFKQLYVITEFIGGGALAQYIMDKKKRPDWKILSRLAKGVARGLIYLEMKSILYRDLKLDNILVTKDFSVVKICDFGMARYKPKDNPDRQRQMTVAGSHLYMVIPFSSYILKIIIFIFQFYLIFMMNMSDLHYNHHCVY